MRGETGAIESIGNRECRSDSDAVIDGVSRTRRGGLLGNETKRSTGPVSGTRDRDWIEPIGVVRHE